MPDQAGQPIAGEQSTGQWIGNAENIMDFVSRFVHIKQHHQEQALSELQGLYSLDKAGFPISDKAYSKLVKKSGLPLETDTEKLKSWLSSQQTKTGGTQAQAQGGQQPQQGGGGQGSPAYMQKVVDAANKVKTTGKALDPSELMGLQMHALAGRARQTQEKLQNTQAMTTQQKAENELEVENLHQRGLAGDEQARGQLMRMGDIKIDMDFEKWNAMNPQQHSGMMDRMAGNESAAERIQRATNIGESLITSGRFSDPQDSMQAGRILAEGGELPAALRSRMKLYTFSELSDQAILAGRLTEIGVPGDKLGSVMKAATAGGLENALPTGMKPLALRTMEMEGGRMEIEALRYAKEVEIAKRAAAAEARKGMSDEAKSQLEEFKSLVELKKSGGKVPDDIIKGAQAKAAKALGLEPSDTKTLWNFLTGGTKTEYKPTVSKEGQSVIDELSGAPERSKEPEPSGGKGFKGFVKGLTKKKEEDDDGTI